MAVHFSGGAPKGASPKNYGITAFNQSKEVREGGLETIKGEQARIASSTEVWNRFLADTRETEIVEAESHKLANEVDTNNRRRIFEAEQRNREIEIRNIQKESANQIRALDTLGKFVGHGVQIGTIIHQKRRNQLLDEQDTRFKRYGLTGEQLEAIGQYTSDVKRNIDADKLRKPIVDLLGSEELADKYIRELRLNNPKYREVNKDVVARLIGEGLAHETKSEAHNNQLITIIDETGASQEIKLGIAKQRYNLGSDNPGLQGQTLSKEVDLIVNKYNWIDKRRFKRFIHPKINEVQEKEISITKEQKSKQNTTNWFDNEALSIAEFFKTIKGGDGKNVIEDPQQAWEATISLQLDGLDGKNSKYKLRRIVSNAALAVQKGHLPADDAISLRNALVNQANANKNQAPQPVSFWVPQAVRNLDDAILQREKADIDLEKHRTSKENTRQAATVRDFTDGLKTVDPSTFGTQYFLQLKEQIQKTDPGNTKLLNLLTTLVKDNPETTQDTQLTATYKKRILQGNTSEIEILQQPGASWDWKSKTIKDFREFQKTSPQGQIEQAAFKAGLEAVQTRFRKLAGTNYEEWNDASAITKLNLNRAEMDYRLNYSKLKEKDPANAHQLAFEQFEKDVKNGVYSFKEDPDTLTGDVVTTKPRDLVDIVSEIKENPKYNALKVKDVQDLKAYRARLEKGHTIWPFQKPKIVRYAETLLLNSTANGNPITKSYAIQLLLDNFDNARTTINLGLTPEQLGASIDLNAFQNEDEDLGYAWLTNLDPITRHSILDTGNPSTSKWIINYTQEVENGNYPNGWYTDELLSESAREIMGTYYPEGGTN